MSPAMRTSLEAYQPKTIMYDESRTLRPAAVALLIGRESGGIIFTVRSSSLPQHAGQISFPGGALDAGETPEEAALRETEEEIGLPRARVQIMGALDKFQSVSDYFVHSFVGEWEESRLEHSRAEIEKVFTAPLEYFLHPQNCRKEMWNRFGREREMYIWNYEGMVIWGLTARILANFFSVVTGQDLAQLLPESPSTMAQILATVR